MKTPREIRHKIKQAKYRHLKRAIRNGLSRKPCNCYYNRVVRPPNQPNMGVCMKGSQDLSTWKGVVCDENMGGSVKLPIAPSLRKSALKKKLLKSLRIFLMMPILSRSQKSTLI